jgi:DNA polymerase V
VRPPPSGAAVIRAYAHLDADCFYVSAERVRGKPVGVFGNQGAWVITR